MGWRQSPRTQQLGETDVSACETMAEYLCEVATDRDNGVPMSRSLSLLKVAGPSNPDVKKVLAGSVRGIYANPNGHRAICADAIQQCEAEDGKPTR